MMIRLQGTTPLAQGSERVIYAHPDDPDALIKVLIPQDQQDLPSGMRAVTQAWFPLLRHRSILKEYAEYARVALLADGTPLPIAHMRGFVQTDLGLGCLTERVAAASGELAQTLEELAEVDDSTLNAVNEMIARVLALGLRASDLTPRNVVLGHRAGGPFEAVLVDGFGDIHAVPVRTWSRRLNRIALRESLTKLARRTGLHWDDTAGSLRR